MREISPGTIRGGSFTYEYEYEIQIVLAIVMFPIIMMMLIIFYGTLGLCIVFREIFNLLMEKMDEQKREPL